MTKARKLVLFIIISLVLLVYSGLKYSYIRSREHYQRYFIMNAVYKDSSDDLKDQIISFYQERIKLNFPDSAELLYANDAKGELLETATAVSMKLRIDNDDREAFEKQIQLKNNKDFILQKHAWISGLEGCIPKTVWNPDKLEKANKYDWDYDGGCGCTLWIGQEDGETLIYLFYGV